ncbi:TolB family protein [Streptomyces variegatus]|uniref:TolB family protein n=1 Tax=Streptomyces variegatus TaxID=284040 RepID=UPI000ABC48C5|nr:PD40 domain-containing protein [Streptomyces variegatus]
MSAGFISRRGFLNSTAGLTAGLAPGIAPVDAPATVSGDPTSVVTYRAITGGSVTTSGSGQALIAEVQGVFWSIPQAGGGARQLTDWPLEATRPALSPDGETIAVCGYRGGGFHLWSLRSDGTGLRRLTDGHRQRTAPPARPAPVTVRPCRSRARLVTRRPMDGPDRRIRTVGPARHRRRHPRRAGSPPDRQARRPPHWSIHDGLPRRQADLTALRQAGHARPPHGTTWLETARAMQRGSCCGVQ